jgi:hypothetical protein
VNASTVYEHDAPMELHRVEIGVGCADCGEHQEPGTLTLTTSDGAYFYFCCYPCVAIAYEAFKAARG